jgi:hypothetical protein
VPPSLDVLDSKMARGAGTMHAHAAQRRQQIDARCSGPHDLGASRRHLASSAAGSLCSVLAAWMTIGS